MLPQFSWSQALGGSFVFMILVVCSVVTLTVSLERIWYYWKRGGNAKQALNEILRRIDAGQIREAAWSCQATPHPLGPVSAVLFEEAGSAGAPSATASSTASPLAASDEKIQVALSRQKLLLERNLGILGTMAATAPLIGLLGTVWGIMRAFEDMARVGSAAPTVVAAGVAEALITTAAGLMVAIPAVMLYNHFGRRMNVMLITAENGARSIREALATSPRPVPASAAPSREAHPAVARPAMPSPAGHVPSEKRLVEVIELGTRE